MALSIKTAKISGAALQAAMRQFLKMYRKQRDTPKHGKQTLMLGKIHGAENNVVMHMTFIYVGGYDILVLAPKYFIGKLLADGMGFFIVHFSRLKGLYQMVGKVVALVHCPLPGFLKFNVRCFNSAAIGGHQHFPVRLCRIGDVVQSFL